MHLLKLLVPILSVGFVAAQTCDGIQKDDICCKAECGTCGGSGCGRREGGADECCTSRISEANKPCGSAPCVLRDGDVSPTPTDTQTCAGTNDVPGVSDSKGEVCCPPGCSGCRGTGCGGFGENCCGGPIFEAGIFCDDSGEAPCLIGSGDVSPTPTDTQTCAGTDGVPGVSDSRGEVCCPPGCSGCRGTGCGGFGENCCGGPIFEAGIFCDDSGEAPCLIGSGDTATPTPPTPTPPTPTPPTPTPPTPRLSGFECDGPSTSSVCCSAGCGMCGGSGCGSSGGSGDVCCVSDVTATCSDTQNGPCILSDDVSPTPTSPTPTPPAATSCPSSAPLPSFRYAASTGLNGRLYAEGEGCFTMTDLYNFRGEETGRENLGETKGPVYVLDGKKKVTAPAGSFTNKWLLEAELFITGGATFQCVGSGSGGDCDELRIESLNENRFHEVRGYGGNLYFEDTVVTSWDTPNEEPQEKHEGGRSFLNCVSEKLESNPSGGCDGSAKNDMGECRMDIIDTEIGYLGYFDAESYGLTWKVRGLCRDLSNQEVFEITNVYGDIRGSDIHHNYYGHYSYGHQGGVWDNNKMHDNHQYGFDPHDDSDFLTISNNEVYNNVNHGIIASKRCNNVKIFNNRVRDGGAQAAGIFLHRSSDHAEVYDNVIENMQDAGIAMLESFDAEIRNNHISGAKFGIRMSLGTGRNQVFDNVFEDITQYGLYTYEGSDAPDVAGGRPFGNVFTSNTVENCDIGARVKEGDDNSFIENTFININTYEFPDSTDTTWMGNSLGGGCIEEDDLDDFDLTSGSDSIPTC